MKWDPCMPYMVTFTIIQPPMLAYIPYMDPMGYEMSTTFPTNNNLRMFSKKHGNLNTFSPRNPIRWRPIDDPRLLDVYIKQRGSVSGKWRLWLVRMINEKKEPVFYFLKWRFRIVNLLLLMLIIVLRNCWETDLPTWYAYPSFCAFSMNRLQVSFVAPTPGMDQKKTIPGRAGDDEIANTSKHSSGSGTEVMTGCFASDHPGIRRIFPYSVCGVPPWPVGNLRELSLLSPVTGPATSNALN